MLWFLGVQGVAHGPAALIKSVENHDVNPDLQRIRICIFTGSSGDQLHINIQAALKWIGPHPSAL